MWKAATYMEPRDSWGCITALPTFKVGERELADNQAFMDSFFPPMAPAQEELLTNAPVEIQWHPISELKTYRSLKATRSSTAPDEDGVPCLAENASGNIFGTPSPRYSWCPSTWTTILEDGEASDLLCYDNLTRIHARYVSMSRRGSLSTRMISVRCATAGWPR